MHQTWSTFSALHWRYDPVIVQRLLPEGLTVDTHDGVAWVSLTPFLMADVRLVGLPPVPGLSSFPETNVRTYVRDPQGRDGLWFFTLEAASLAFTGFARATVRAPYAWARMAVEARDGTVHYSSSRRVPGPEDAHASIVVEAGDALAPAELSELDDFLTGRWRGYAPTLLGLCFLPIEHEPWPLHRARLEKLDETLVTSCGLPEPGGDPIVHYSSGVHARFGPPVPVARS